MLQKVWFGTKFFGLGLVLGSAVVVGFIGCHSHKVFVGCSQQISQNTSQGWTTFREGSRLWLVVHGYPDGRTLHFNKCKLGDNRRIRLAAIAQFLSDEGVNLAGVNEIVVHSCFNGRWQPFREDGILVRPSQNKHQGEVHTRSMGGMFFLLP